MSRFGFYIFWVALVWCLVGCNANSPIIERDTEQPATAWGANLLPGIPQNPAAKNATEAGSHVFTVFDMVDYRYASWNSNVLSLELQKFAYSIVSFNLGTSNPTDISVDGTLSGMWLAVSDYDRGGWHFLGEHSAPQSHDISDGNYKSPTGWIYFALVCPGGASADVTTTLDFDTVPPTEFDPPVWQDGVGIKSLDTSSHWPMIEWYPAVDAESPPVTYLIYYALQTEGIDWDTPYVTVPAQFTSTSIFIDEDTELCDYGVRAMDAQGNVTENTNLLSGTIVESMAFPFYDWVPGDKLVMTWDDPTADNMFVLIGPHYLEGWPGEPDLLDGLVDFSDPSPISGVAEVWATPLETAPEGGYLVEGHMGSWNLNHPETFSYSLYDSDEILKVHLGNYTIDSGGTMADLFYLRNGVSTWPQRELWEAGDRLEVTWDDPAVNVDLWVMSPSWMYGFPAHPEDLAGQIDFSQPSEESGEAVEWAELAAGGELGVYDFSIGWESSGEPDPGTFVVTWTLYDNEGGVRLGPGTAEISSDWGSVYPLFWLDRE